MGVQGFAGKSKKGELSIFAVNMQILSYCLHMLPKRGIVNQVCLLALPAEFRVRLSRCQGASRMGQRTTGGEGGVVEHCLGCLHALQRR